MPGGEGGEGWRGSAFVEGRSGGKGRVEEGKLEGEGAGRQGLGEFVKATEKILEKKSLSKVLGMNVVCV